MTKLPFTRPTRATPLRWALPDATLHNLEALNELKMVYDRWLRLNGFEMYRIDELAVMVRTPEEAMYIASKAVEVDGVELFNHANDTVYTEPFQTRYRVSYSFLRTSHGFRVELMNLNMSQGNNRAFTGFSPLHEAMWDVGQKLSGAPIVHASFKCNDPAEYDEVVSALSTMAQHAQTCTSRYGGFSYWLPYNMPHLVYLKPRVNMRDNGDWHVTEEEVSGKPEMKSGLQSVTPVRLPPLTRIS